MVDNSLAVVAVSPVIGSFLNVVAVRLPLSEVLLWGRSRCRSCEGNLFAKDLVPLLSWIVLKGRCRFCAAQIPAAYPVVELLAIGVALSAYFIFTGWLVWATCFLGWTLLTLAAIDLKHQILPDVLTLPLAVGGLVIGFADSIDTGLQHTIGAMSGFLLFYTVARVYRAARHQDGLGLGDAKLMAAAGAWIGWLDLPFVLLVAAVSALAAVALRAALSRGIDINRRIAFGPYLAVAFFAVWLARPTWLWG
jgi:leader peptidase (prepilin peptidase)/N-methyltransferase